MITKNYNSALLFLCQNIADQKGHSAGIMPFMCFNASSLLHASWNCEREEEGDIIAVPRATLICPRDDSSI